MQQFKDSMLALIHKASTELPHDVRHMLQEAQALEQAGSRSASALGIINDNITMADTNQAPLCQDTGLPTFKIMTPVGSNHLVLKQLIHEAIVESTHQSILRPNTVDSLTGHNSGNNLGEGAPIIKIEQWEHDYIEAKLILKGGGCENKNIQYSLPCELEGLGKAGRDLDGVRKCILHSVYQAQGQGCSPGIIGVAVGGDRTSGYEYAKAQLFRELSDINPNPDLANLEDYVLQTANELAIGTLGFGGKISLLGCKIGSYHRLPASFFVSVAYNCWAFRRVGMRIDATTGQVMDWLYDTPPATPTEPQVSKDPTSSAENVVHLSTPITEAQIRSLKMGDVVSISGMIYTGRDAIHHHLHEQGTCPVDLNGQVIYHCGPVMAQDPDGTYHVRAAGPTTSMREEPYQGAIMKQFGLRAVIGKGGMGAKTLAALQEHGGVYINAIGGAAQYYAQSITGVEGVDFLDFGTPEAMWHLRVNDFRGVVTMDAHGNSLHKDIDKTSLERLATHQAKVF